MRGIHFFVALLPIVRLFRCINVQSIDWLCISVSFISWRVIQCKTELKGLTWLFVGITGNYCHVIASFLFTFSTLDGLNRQTNKKTNKQIVYKFEYCNVTLISTWKVAKPCTLGGPNMTGTRLWSTFLPSLLHFPTERNSHRLSSKPTFKLANNHKTMCSVLAKHSLSTKDTKRTFLECM